LLGDHRVSPIQNVSSTGREPDDHQGRARGRPPCNRIAWMGRRDTPGQRTRLPFHRRSKPAGAFQAGRRCSTPRWRGHHHRCRAGRSVTRQSGRNRRASRSGARSAAESRKRGCLRTAAARHREHGWRFTRPMPAPRSGDSPALPSPRPPAVEAQSRTARHPSVCGIFAHRC